MPDLCHIISPHLNFFLLLLILKVLAIGRWERLKYFPTEWCVDILHRMFWLLNWVETHYQSTYRFLGCWKPDSFKPASWECDRHRRLHLRYLVRAALREKMHARMPNKLSELMQAVFNTVQYSSIGLISTSHLPAYQNASSLGLWQSRARTLGLDTNLKQRELWTQEHNVYHNESQQEK